jgi:hypothetical protein
MNELYAVLLSVSIIFACSVPFAFLAYSLDSIRDCIHAYSVSLSCLAYSAAFSAYLSILACSKACFLALSFLAFTRAFSLLAYFLAYSAALLA